MSAQMSWLDWVSLLDLFNTPYPNQPYGSRHGGFYEELDIARNQHNEKRFIFLARQWVLYHAGIQDADQGRSIWNELNKYLDRWYKNKTGPDVYMYFRHKIWGNCHQGGQDWNNFQPCPPPKCNWDDNAWNGYYMYVYKEKGYQVADKIIDQRNKLNDKLVPLKLKEPQKSYTYLAASERLDLPMCWLLPL